jgi:hypothetical protein
MIQAKTVFYINSRDRVSGTDGHFTFKMNLPPHNKYDYACVLEAQIPKSYYLVQNTYNTFVLQENGVNTTITVDVGNYSRRSFQTVLQNLLNASTTHGWVYTISYPSTATTAETGKFTYTVTGNGGLQPSFIFTSNLFEQLRFDENSTNTCVASSLTSANVIKMQVEDTLFLHFNLANNGQDDILQEIYSSSSTDFSNVTYTCRDVDAYSKNITSNNDGVYTFSLTNESGHFMNLNGLNMNFTLLLYQKDPVWQMVKDGIKLQVMLAEKKPVQPLIDDEYIQVEEQ